MKILIIQTAFIGDVILATPVIASLHQHHPDWQIDVLVRKGNESLLNNFKGLRKLLIWDKKKNKNRNLLNLIAEIRKEKYDEVINLQRFGSTGFLTALSGAKRKTGFDKNPFSIFFDRKIKHEIGNDKHETERNLLLIEHLGADKSLRPVLYPSSEDFKNTNPYKALSYICIAPTSVWFTKQLPKAQWLKLINAIERENKSDYRIYLLGGPPDRDECEKIKSESANSKVINLAGSLSFLQTAALMKDALMNYVNDSAPMHIASAMNAPVTAVYCSTVPAFGFGPLSDNSKIMEIEEALYCRPCGLHGYKACPQGHFKCALEIRMEKGLIKF